MGSLNTSIVIGAASLPIDTPSSRTAARPRPALAAALSSPPSGSTAPTDGQNRGPPPRRPPRRRRPRPATARAFGCPGGGPADPTAVRPGRSRRQCSRPGAPVHGVGCGAEGAGQAGARLRGVSVGYRRGRKAAGRLARERGRRARRPGCAARYRWPDPYRATPAQRRRPPTDHRRWHSGRRDSWPCRRHHLVEGDRNARPRDAGPRDRLVEVRAHHADLVTLVRRISGQALVEHARQRIDVGPIGDFALGEPLRGHVLEGAHRGADLRQLFVGGGAGDPEVDEIGEVVPADQNVLRFHVAMQSPRPRARHRARSRPGARSPPPAPGTAARNGSRCWPRPCRR